MMSVAIELLVSRWLEIVNPPGVNWGKFASDGGVRGLGYMQEMLAAVASLDDVVGALDIEDRFRTLRASEGAGSLAELGNALALAAPGAADASDRGLSDVTLGQALTMSGDALKDAVATMAAYAANGAQLHFDGVMFDALNSEFATDEEVMDHADSVVRSCRSFRSLFDSGALNEIRRQDPDASVAGLGFAALAIPVWMLVVAGTFLILGLAYLFWSTHRSSVLQDKVVAWCDQLIVRDPGAATACIKSLQNMQNDTLASLTDPIQQVVKWLGIGLCVYVGILAMPGLVKAGAEIMRSRKGAPA